MTTRLRSLTAAYHLRGRYDAFVATASAQTYVYPERGQTPPAAGVRPRPVLQLGGPAIRLRSGESAGGLGGASARRPGLRRAGCSVARPAAPPWARSAARSAAMRARAPPSVPASGRCSAASDGCAGTEEEQQQQQSYQMQQQSSLAQGHANYNRAFGACMSGSRLHGELRRSRRAAVTRGASSSSRARAQLRPSALSIAPISACSSKGLRRYSTAPARRARSRVGGSSWAVMKMIGNLHRRLAQPLLKLEAAQARRGGRPAPGSESAPGTSEASRSSPEPNVLTVKPSDPSSR